MFGITRTGSTLGLPIPATWPGLDRRPDAATTEACGQGVSWPHKANQEPIIPAWGDALRRAGAQQAAAAPFIRQSWRCR